MKNYLYLFANTRSLRFLVLILCAFSAIAAPRPQEHNSEISFRIASDKAEYRHGERAVISFFVVNRGTSPIYISRGFVCGKWTGFVDFHIQNARGENIRNGGCDVVVHQIPDDKLKQIVTESAGWLRLDPNEMYGEERTFELPRESGSYRVVGELRPPQFSDQQKQVLAAEKIAVLQASHVAPAVQIVVR